MTHASRTTYARRIALRVPARLHDRLIAVAADHGLHVAELIRAALVAELARLSAGRPVAP